MRKKKKPTISELERLLDNDEDTTIEIMPNGEIRAVRKRGRKPKIKPLTVREDLGGEYCKHIERPFCYCDIVIKKPHCYICGLPIKIKKEFQYEKQTIPTSNIRD